METSNNLTGFGCGTLLLALLASGTVLAAETVNINSADAATLARVLQDVSPSKAEAIIDYRRNNGTFRSPEQLAMVRGIDLDIVERNAGRILLEDARNQRPPGPRTRAPVAGSHGS